MTLQTTMGSDFDKIFGDPIKQFKEIVDETFPDSSKDERESPEARQERTDDMKDTRTDREIAEYEAEQEINNDHANDERV